MEGQKARRNQLSDFNRDGSQSKCDGCRLLELRGSYVESFGGPLNEWRRRIYLRGREVVCSIVRKTDKFRDFDRNNSTHQQAGYEAKAKFSTK